MTKCLQQLRTRDTGTKKRRAVPDPTPATRTKRTPRREKGALRLALCMTEGGEAHAVLLIEVAAPEAGHWVIDNRRRQVLPWKWTPYCLGAPGHGYWIARSVPGSFWWEKLAV